MGRGPCIRSMNGPGWRRGSRFLWGSDRYLEIGISSKSTRAIRDFYIPTEAILRFYFGLTGMFDVVVRKKKRLP